MKKTKKLQEFFSRYKDNVKNKNKIRTLVIVIILIGIFFSGYCLAKYEIEKDILSNSKIAVPVLEVEGTETAKISAINNIGYYDFTVKNYNEKNISDVVQNYYIEIISNTDEAIVFNLYDGENIVNLNNNKTDIMQIGAFSKIEHSYRLEVCYDKTKSNSEKDILEDVQLKVHSEQEKP